LPDLAAELAGSGGAMDTLVVRESRSSLAGVVMAVAVEGMSVGEARALMHHGLTGAPHSLKLPHESALPGPLGHVGHGHVSGAVRHELRGLHTASPASTAAAPPTPSPAPAGAPAAVGPSLPEHSGAAGTAANAPGTAPATPASAA